MRDKPIEFDGDIPWLRIDEIKARKKIHAISPRIKNGGKKIPKRGQCEDTP